jgi:hypothetical protein
MTAPFSPTHVADDGDGTVLVPYTPMPYDRKDTGAKRVAFDQPATKGSLRRLVAHVLAVTLCALAWWSACVHVGAEIWTHVQPVVWPDVSTHSSQVPVQPVWHPSRVCTGSPDFWTETACMLSQWFYHAMVCLRSHLFMQVNHLGPMGLYYSASTHWGELSKFVLATVGTWHVIGRQLFVPCGRAVAASWYTLLTYGVNQHRFWYDLLVESICEGLEGATLAADFLAVRHKL